MFIHIFYIWKDDGVYIMSHWTLDDQKKREKKLCWNSFSDHHKQNNPYINLICWWENILLSSMMDFYSIFFFYFGCPIVVSYGEGYIISFQLEFIWFFLLVFVCVCLCIAHMLVMMVVISRLFGYYWLLLLLL